MLKSFRKSGSNPIVWGILAILIVGLVGFGGRVGSGIGASGVASVGDQTVTTDDYVRAVQNEVQSISQQFGQQITVQQAMAFGIDRIVLNKLVTAAALDGQAHDLGVSVGDPYVRDSLLRTQAFQGLDGNFDEAAYKFALDRLNMTPAEYEATIRKAAARDLLRIGISAGVTLPASAASTLLAYSGERRAFSWVTLNASALTVAVAHPSNIEAQAWYDGHSDRFMTPEAREIAYLILTPADLARAVSVSDDQAKEAYDDRIAEFEQPETRAVERLAFASADDANAALARLNAGAITFEGLVAERDLELADLDLGIIDRNDLDPEAQASVFDPTEPGIYGPSVTLLGPALFRVNAIFAPQSTSFESASAQLKLDIALQEASGLVADEAVRLDDLTAGGATFEQMAAETAFTLRNLSWHAGLSDGIAADPAFQAAAAAAVQGEVRDPIDLADGGVALLRLDSITAPALRPFAEVKAEAIAGLQAEIETAEIAKVAEALKAAIPVGGNLGDLALEKSLTLRPAEPVLRSSTVADAPAGLVARLFELKDLETTVITGPGRADIIQLTAVTAFDPNSAGNKALAAEASRQLSEQVGSDLFAVFANQAQQEAGVSVNAPLVQALLERFQ